MARLLRRVDTIVPRRAKGFGGKAKNLAALSRAGFPVPAAFALPGEAFEQYLESILPEEDRPAALLAGPPDDVTPSRLTAIATRVRESAFPEPIEKAIVEAFERLTKDGARGVAVRSSSTREDQESASGAGLYESVLNVTDVGGVIAAVKHCYASFFCKGALTYLRRTTGNEPSMGVVLQAMVPADVSGVLFTINPLTGDAGEMVINAGYGLGTSIVGGSISPDTVRIDKVTGESRDRVIGEKARRVVANGGGGLREEDVSEDEKHRLCLDDAMIEELSALGLRIEHHFQDARDVEWAYADGRIYVLQARPVTTVVSTPSPKASRKKRLSRSERSKLVWSNVNVGEALPGVATPLTWSVAAGFSELGFRRAFGALGCTVPKDAELVGNFRGRIYLNLTEFMGILSQVPYLRPRTLLALGGGGEADRLEAEIEPRSRWGFLARLPWTVMRFAQENYRITDRATAFEHSFSAERRRLGDVDLRVLSPIALDHVLRDVERLLDEAGGLMLTCYGNLLSTVVALRAVLSIVARADADALQRDLLSGLTDVDSAAPGLSLWHIAEMARLEPTVAERLLNTSPAELRIADLPVGPTRRALENFTRAHGYRGPKEAEIAAPRWEEDPTLLFATLRIHLARPPEEGGPVEIERRQRKIRERAEADLERRMPAPARVAVRHLLALVQRFLRLRERLRSHVVEVLGMFRRVALDASRRIAATQPEIGADAAFFLTLDELHAVLRKEIEHIGPLVRQRRAQYERDAALPDPPDTFVGFPPPVPEAPPDVDRLRGLAASAGKVEGNARVLLTTADAAEFQAGEILISPSADVGWSPLFLVAAALVTDLGGPLSHAAIVLREFGIPAVVNVKVGTRVIRTGDRILVDGDRGEVRILEAMERGATPSNPACDHLNAGA